MAAQINGFAESIRDQMGTAADALRDLDPAADPSARQSENAVYHLWKGVAGYGMLLREDLLRQTNAITITTAPSIPVADGPLAAMRQEQAEAAELTTLFKDHFEQTVPPEGLSVPVPPATNTVTAATNATKQVLSPEDRAKILTLSDEALAQQRLALAATNLHVSLPYQRRSHDVLKEIEKLLPKQESPSPQQQQKPSEQPQDQQKQPQPQDQQKPQESKPEPKPAKEEKTPDSMARDEVQRMLEKARQREKDHELEKRQRDAYAPLSPVDRDW
jgi:hypothetical protein